MIRYRCLLCRRERFDRPNTPHRCIGGFRKHGLRRPGQKRQPWFEEVQAHA